MWRFLLLAPVLGQLFQSVTTEYHDEIPLETIGALPPLHGTLYRNGFGKFEGHGFTFTHLFDTMALLLSFRIEDGSVWSRVRLLDSDYKHDAEKTLPLYRTLDGTVPPPDWRALVHGLHDNRNGNLVPYGDILMAINDMAGGVLVDATLNVVGSFTPSWLAIMSSTHPMVHRWTQATYNYELNVAGYYEIYKLEGTQRTTVSRIPVDTFSLIHSFSITEQYLVLAVYPTQWNASALLETSILPHVVWNDTTPTRFYLVHLATGDVSWMESDPVFAFHHVNAYEQGKTIILDMIVYPNHDVFHSLTLDQVRTQPFPGGTVRRYVLHLDTGHVTWQSLGFPSVEMPSIHPAYQSVAYEYMYGMGVDETPRLYQFHVPSGQKRVWMEPDQYPTEPVFVATGDNETDGVLLSVVLDEPRQRSYLLFLDTDMNVLAKAYVPSVVPFTCHGFFQHIDL